MKTQYTLQLSGNGIPQYYFDIPNSRSRPVGLDPWTSRYKVAGCLSSRLCVDGPPLPNAAEIWISCWWISLPFRLLIVVGPFYGRYPVVDGNWFTLRAGFFGVYLYDFIRRRTFDGYFHKCCEGIGLPVILIVLYPNYCYNHQSLKHKMGYEPC